MSCSVKQLEAEKKSRRGLPNAGQRALSGGIYIAVIVCSILLHEYVYVSLFFFFALATTNELYTLIGRNTTHRPNRILGLLAGALFYFGFFVAVRQPNIAWMKGIILGAKLCSIAIATLLLVLPAIQLLSKHPTPIQNWGITILGWLYVIVPFSLAPALVAFGDEQTTWQLLLFPIIMVWINDTGAYCIGSLLGQHKLCSRITPSKTIEGCIGGIILTGASGLLFAQFVTKGSAFEWIGLGLLIGALAVLGDLVESQFKRSLDVKDSGKFLPGHGGFLDRFDSMLFAFVGAMAFYMVVF